MQEKDRDRRGIKKCMQCALVGKNSYSSSNFST